MHLTSTQILVWQIALLITTFFAGCQVGQTFRKFRPINAKKAKK
jgi:hypothetical protein